MQKFNIKTDMPEIKEVLSESGFVVQGNKVSLKEGEESLLGDNLERAVINLEKRQSFDLLKADDVRQFEQEGPTLAKRLGEMPGSNRGLSNWMSIALFLAIDVIAIIVGVYLLIK